MTPRAPAITALEKTVLPNGVTVYSSDDHGPVSAVTAYFRAGTRYETADTHGAAQYANTLAFQVVDSFQQERERKNE